MFIPTWKNKIAWRLSKRFKCYSVTALSREYGVAKSTVCSIKNKKKKIIEAVAHSSTWNKKRTLRKAEFPKMEGGLYRWFLKQSEKNVPITADILTQKELFFHEKFNQGVGNFNASYGWLQRFKKRFDFWYLKITGEKLSSAPELVDPFKELLKLKFEEFDLNQHQIYNADETGLFWKLLPEKNIGFAQWENCSRFKNGKTKNNISWLYKSCWFSQIEAINNWKIKTAHVH
jgi:hypothetical protein